MKTLLLGYGNQDRQDDGVAWHVLVELKRALHIPDPELVDEDFNAQEDLAFVFQLQLMPEMAEDIARFDRVCFIDAHTGAVPEEIHFETLSPMFQSSPLTHHLTPNSLLSIIKTLYQKDLEAVLLSIKGYEFEFSRELSPSTAALVPLAIERIETWLMSH